MLIIPLHKKLDWKNPPLVTLFFVLTNVLVFLVFQLDDDQETADAIAYYGDSGLAELEWDPFLAYLEQRGDDDTRQEITNYQPGDPPYWVFILQRDRDFLKALHSDRIFDPADEVYREWREKRQRFEALYEGVTWIGFGLRTTEPTLMTVISHMFLHANASHLIGNMIFLLAVGLLVEAVLTRKAYFLLYFLVGAGAAAFYVLIEERSTTLVGASGAIAGLMGAYTVLYGLKKVRFFYFIGLYFDFVRLPALVLLPLWIGNEIVQMQLDSESGVAYAAHLGGLIAGALLAYLFRLSRAFSLEPIESEENSTRFEQQLEQARNLCGTFDYDAALPKLRRLHSERPDHLETLSLFYECVRLYPSSDEYHRIAHRVLSLRTNGWETNELVRRTFNDYVKRARPKSRLNAALICHLAGRFAAAKMLPEAEQLVNFILKRQLPCPNRDALLARLSDILAEKGRQSDGRKYRRLLTDAPT